MARVDLISDALNQISMYEELGRKECIITPISNILIDILKKLKELNYIGEFEIIENNRGRIVRLNLIGKINKCHSIRPRFSVKIDDIEKFEKRYLPARNFGSLILSTPKGVISHKEAKDKRVGGKLLAYIY